MRKQPVGFATKGHGRTRKVYPLYKGYKGNPRGGGMTVSSVIEAQQLRSPTAQRIDAANKAPIAKTNEQWLSEPNRYDLPGIDTPDTQKTEPHPTKEQIKNAKETKAEFDKINYKSDLEEIKNKETSKDSEFEKWLETKEARKAYTDQIMIDNKKGNTLRNWEEYKQIPEAREAFEKFKQKPAISKISGSSATYNKATGWMAISFSGIPDPEVRAEMKENGFRYNPSRKQWVAKWYPYREELAKKYAGELQHVDIKPNYAAKAEYAAGMAAKHEQKANETFNRAEKMSSIIPFGQPILVDHYSAKSDRNYRNRMNNTYRKSFEEQKIADKYQERAERYGQKATGESSGLIYRRIQKLEAEKRKMERHKAEAIEKKASSSIAWADKWLNEYNNRLTVEKEKYKASGGLPVENTKLSPGDRVYTRYGVGTIVTISKKTSRIKLDPDPISGRPVGIYANSKGESLVQVDKIKDKLTPDQIERYNQAVEAHRQRQMQAATT